MLNSAPTLSVVVPTYRRPDYLARCVASLAAQERIPDEIVVISRDSDAGTNAKIDELAKGLAPIRFVHGFVSQAGFLPPIRRGIELSKGDVVAFIDDDAEAFPDWTRRLLAPYSVDDVGGVGGRCINIFNGIPATYPVAKEVGRLYWYGRGVGNMYRDVSFDEPRDVDFLLGGNMSYRRSILTDVGLDPVIGNNVAVHWELDVGLKVKKAGFRIIFDPMVRVNHYSAPREIEGMRSINTEGVYWSNFNYAYLMMKHLTPIGRVAYLAHTFLIGGTTSSGIAHLGYLAITRRTIDWRRDLVPSMLGRASGVAEYWRTRRLRRKR